MNPALHSSDRMDWETPPDFFEELHREFGFTLDVCATPENAKVRRYFTPEDDGLAQDWGDNICWCNPPYGRQIGDWIRKAYEESQRAATVVLLIPARTETAYWHDYVMRGEVRFIRGRLKFVGARYNAPFPCAVVIFR